MPMVAAAGSSSPLSASKPKAKSISPTAKGIWSLEEHDRFLEAMKLFPKGPWKSIADHIATRSVRQVQTHAQKYQEKVSRRLRGLRKSKKKLVRPEHRIDEDTMELCKLVDCAAGKLVAASKKSTLRVSVVVLEPLQKKNILKEEPVEPHSSPRGTDVDMKTDDFLPLPFLDFGEDIDLDPVHIPTVSESLDFLIDYLSI
ncbi:myb-like DNA-binding protein, putative [Phytophthora infestans T30-4]|uniref:Myb-like DNA-binding protein, putative n=2 Tax=Phytophthora infestans TaxID=4787 RepID=D0MR02_PHYIT|nr:myb-like DNA-binding protein, putative [Phytophthora infestans T30-4]EEY57921.1 myb-like DNA-binding protein, putative [Phytophthora infestans T30-4]KAF4031608.1 Myb-like DNA-binding domain [Phytophthora infestans]|eukprot:XP_002909107.1 myb-like DNA-binding protein, putative [Phytophthora infestans T30-4]